MVFDDTFLFSDTIRANIAYGRPDASEDEIRAAARAAAVDDFVEELPDAYDTVVGERGLTLSGGQRQRVALARAILCDPAILVLDDATSAVDARIEERIHVALRSVLAGRTTILIAHRRSTLHLADRIVVLEAGRVVDQGTHDELVARSPLYRALITGLEEEDEERVDDRIEALAFRVVDPVAGGNGSSTLAPVGRARIGPPSLGAGLGGSGGARSNSRSRSRGFRSGRSRIRN